MHTTVLQCIDVFFSRYQDEVRKVPLPKGTSVKAEFSHTCGLCTPFVDGVKGNPGMMELNAFQAAWLNMESLQIYIYMGERMGSSNTAST